MTKVAASSCGRALMLVVLALMGWVPLAALILSSSGCSESPGRAPDPTVRLPSTRHSALTGTGPVVAASASFDAPVVDPATWQGAPMGTGSYSIPLQPAINGGPNSVAASDASSGSNLYYVVIQDFHSATGTALAVLSDLPFAVGTVSLDPAHYYVAAFDVVSGDPVAEVQTGTLTLTAAGTAPNSRITGSLSADFQAVAAPACTTNAQCRAGEVCLGGACVVPPGCTSNAQCAAGQTCQNGACISAPGCTSNAQCPSGQQCQRGTCVAAPGCTSSAQCPSGQACQSGQCVPSTPVSCLNLQGSGTLSASQGSIAACSAAGAVSLSIANAVAMVTDSPSGGPAIIVLDPATQSEGLELDLNACPSGPGTLAVGSGLEAVLYASPKAVGQVTLFAAYQAVGGSITFTQVGTTLAGTANLTFDNGGTATASFTLQ